MQHVFLINNHHYQLSIWREKQLYLWTCINVSFYNFICSFSIISLFFTAVTIKLTKNKSCQALHLTFKLRKEKTLLSFLFLLSWSFPQRVNINFLGYIIPQVSFSLKMKITFRYYKINIAIIRPQIVRSKVNMQRLLYTIITLFNCRNE